MTREIHKRPTSPYEDGRLRLEEYDVVGSDGKKHLRTVVRHPDAVVLLAFPAEDRILMIRNERLSVGGKLLELPAGCLEDGETPVEGAARELSEETGYRAGMLEPMVAFYPSPGLTDERMHVFVATELVPGPRNLDPTEHIDVEEWAVEALLEAIDRGEVEDAKTIAAALLWARKRAGS